MTPTTTRTGHAIAWLSFVLGITVSIAANVLHAAEGTWTTPELIGAGFWPLALLLSIEVLTRVVWPTGWLWGAARFGGVGLVALVAAVLSYRHMQSLLTSWGEDAWNAHLGPLAVDGLMLVAATALLAISRANQAADIPPLSEVVAAVEERDEAGNPEQRDDDMLRRILAGLPETRRLEYAAPIGPQPLLTPTDLPDGSTVFPSGIVHRPPKPPETPKQPRAPRQTKKQEPSAAYDDAFRYWQQNPEVSAGQLAERFGVSRATGGRWLKDWRSMAPVT